MLARVRRRGRPRPARPLRRGCRRRRSSQPIAQARRAGAASTTSATRRATLRPRRRSRPRARRRRRPRLGSPSVSALVAQPRGRRPPRPGARRARPVRRSTALAKALGRLADRGLDGLGGVPRPLRADAHRVQRGVGRGVLRGRRPRCAAASTASAHEVAEHLARGRRPTSMTTRGVAPRPRAGRATQVALAAHPVEQHGARGLAIGHEPLQERRGRGLVVGLELGDTRSSSRSSSTSASRTAPSSSPSHPSSSRSDCVHSGSSSSRKVRRCGAQAARGDARLVHAFGVLADPHDRGRWRRAWRRRRRWRARMTASTVAGLPSGVRHDVGPAGWRVGPRARTTLGSGSASAGAGVTQARRRRRARVSDGASSANSTSSSRNVPPSPAVDAPCTSSSTSVPRPARRRGSELGPTANGAQARRRARAARCGRWRRRGRRASSAGRRGPPPK